jgi:hypothetical protein
MVYFFCCRHIESASIRECNNAIIDFKTIGLDFFACSNDTPKKFEKRISDENIVNTTKQLLQVVEKKNVNKFQYDIDQIAPVVLASYQIKYFSRYFADKELYTKEIILEATKIVLLLQSIDTYTDISIKSTNLINNYCHIYFEWKSKILNDANIKATRDLTDLLLRQKYTIVRLNTNTKNKSLEEYNKELQLQKVLSYIFRSKLYKSITVAFNLYDKLSKDSKNHIWSEIKKDDSLDSNIYIIILKNIKNKMINMSSDDSIKQHIYHSIDTYKFKSTKTISEKRSVVEKNIKIIIEYFKTALVNDYFEECDINQIMENNNSIIIFYKKVFQII